jgi:flagellar biosynthesis chaperone FliJ
VRSSPLAATLLAVALAGVLVTEPASAQAPPAPTTTAPPAEAAVLAQQRDNLTKQLAELDQTIAQVTTQRDEARDTINATNKRLPENEGEQKATADARQLPLRAREQLAVDLYVRGDPRGRQYLDSLATGQFTLDPLRNAVLFTAAEQDATRQVAELDAKGAQLREEHSKLEKDRDAATQAEASAKTQLTDLNAKKNTLTAQLAEVEKSLRRAEANASGDPLAGTPLRQHRPALAVKIDNHPDARPQSGLNQADIVFEELVEGGITRFVAIFHSTDADPVGPVRSGRTSDLVILTNLNRALFGSSGGNSGVLDELRQTNLASVIENDAPSAYYRENSRDAPHNLYTRTAALYAANPGNAGEPPHMFNFLGAGEPVSSGRPVRSITVRVGNDTVEWSWIDGGWQRIVNGTPEADAAGLAIRPINLIVQFTNYGVSAADANSPEAQALGSGPVWVLSGARLTEGTWVRPKPESVTQYLDSTGADIRLSPGRTWIALAPPGRATVNG